jgi:glycosyl transferase family 25
LRIEHNKTVRPINSFIDKVYVLTVKTFSDRIAHIENEMGKHQINFQFVFSFDIPDIDDALLDKSFEGASLTMAQKSLVLKHLQAWKDAESHNYQRILLFEDDVILNNDFSYYFEKIMTAANALTPGYLIFLGGADAKVPAEFLLSKALLVPLPIATTEAYVTDSIAIKRRLNWQANHKISLPSDHLICKIDKELGNINYWSRTPIVEQGSVTGIFNSHLDSHRQKHSKLFNVLRYRWNKFQRHVLRAQIARLRQLFRSFSLKQN